MLLQSLSSSSLLGYIQSAFYLSRAHRSAQYHLSSTSFIQLIQHSVHYRCTCTSWWTQTLPKVDRTECRCLCTAPVLCHSFNGHTALLHPSSSYQHKSVRIRFKCRSSLCSSMSAADKAHYFAYHSTNILHIRVSFEYPYCSTFCSSSAPPNITAFVISAYQLIAQSPNHTQCRINAFSLFQLIHSMHHRVSFTANDSIFVSPTVGGVCARV